MMKSILLASALVAAPLAPLLAAPSAQPKAVETPDPEKAALAARVAAALWPDGSYGRMVDSMIGGDEDSLADTFLDMRPADIMGAVAGSMAAEAGEQKPPSAPPAKQSRTLREELAAEDPHFEERMRIMTKVIGEEVNRIAKPIEPKFRDGLAKSIARRFTRQQLVPIAAFFESDAGKAYAAQSMTMFLDKDVLLAMVQAVPAIIKEMPSAFEKVEKATAHLPKPKSKAKSADDGRDSGDSGEEPGDTPDELPST